MTKKSQNRKNILNEGNSSAAHLSCGVRPIPSRPAGGPWTPLWDLVTAAGQEVAANGYRGALVLNALLLVFCIPTYGLRIVLFDVHAHREYNGIHNAY